MSDEQILSEAERALSIGDVAGAEATLSRKWPGLARAPGDALHLMASIRLRQGRVQEAEKCFRDAVAAEPQSLRHTIALGHARVELEDYAGAAEAYAQAIRINRAWPGLMLVYSNANYQCGRLDEAEKAARQAIKDAPSVEAWNALSNAMRGQNKAAEALQAADEALRLNPGDQFALHNRGAALLLLGRAQEALSIFESLAAQGIAAPVLSLNRGDALDALGRRAEADAVYAEARTRWPHLPNLQAQIAKRRR